MNPPMLGYPLGDDHAVNIAPSVYGSRVPLLHLSLRIPDVESSSDATFLSAFVALKTVYTYHDDLS